MTCDILNCQQHSTAQCSDCGLRLCDVHTQKCGLCGVVFCPSCVINHAEEHVKPPRVRRTDRFRKKAG